MAKLRVLDLFAGIGGFSLGLERTGGFETVAFCEIEEFPRRVLAKHWPGVPCYHDVRTLTGDILARDGIAVDVITGGFPCQDISVAGKQAGLADGTRSGLWSEIVRLVGELRPRYVIVENVANLLSGPSGRPGAWFGRVLGDLAECGYDAVWENIPASAVGAPHRRERVWLVAYPNKNAREQLRPFPINYATKRQSDEGRFGGHVRDWRGIGRGRVVGGWSISEPSFLRPGHGVSSRLAGDRLAALGNAVVPQIPELIGRAILEAEAAA